MITGAGSERAAALPRGPHSLSRAEVAASQRARLMTAMTELLADRGYEGITIGELVKHARVSRAAFYEHFADKEACLLSAYDEFAAVVARAMSEEPVQLNGWEELAEFSLRRYLSVFDENRTAAQAFLVRMDAAGPAARRRRRDAVHALAGLLAARYASVRDSDPSLNALPGRVLLGYALGVRELIREELEERPGGELVALTPDLVLWLTALVRGVSGA